MKQSWEVAIAEGAEMVEGLVVLVAVAIVLTVIEGAIKVIGLPRAALHTGEFSPSTASDNYDNDDDDDGSQRTHRVLW